MIQPTQLKSNRHGITVVEVLTSIVVAMIGVMGVLIMIPFAVQQSQIGLDLDDATLNADNAVAMFEIQGFNLLNDQGELPWIEAEGNDGFNNADAVNRIGGLMANEDPRGDFVRPGGALLLPDLAGRDERLDMIHRGPYWLDPLGVTAGYTQSNSLDTGSSTIDLATFPFRYVTLADTVFDTDSDGIADFFDTDLDGNDLVDRDEIDADRDGIADVDGRDFMFYNGDVGPAALAPALSRRLMRTGDDLQFALETAEGITIGDNEPPQQIFDRRGTVDLRRQSRGELSWSMILVPRKRNIFDDADSNWNFASHFLVYKDRNLENPGTSAGGQFDSRYPLARIIYPTNPDTSDPMDPRRTTNPYFSGGTINLFNDGRALSIAKDEWVMLVNRVNIDNVPDAEPGFLHQVGFYRVIGSDPERETITLDGPEFNFGVDTDPPNRVFSHTETYVVYLPGVVNVYERSMSWESSSTQNN